MYCICSIIFATTSLLLIMYKQWTKCPQYKPAAYHLVYQLLRCYQSKTERNYFLAIILAPLITFALIISEFLSHLPLSLPSHSPGCKPSGFIFYYTNIHRHPAKFPFLVEVLCSYLKDLTKLLLCYYSDLLNG